MDQHQVQQNDHDLLIELRTKMNTVGTDINEIKKTLSDSLASIHESKFDKTDAFRMEAEIAKNHEDHENRIRTIERWVWTAIGGLAVLQIVLKFFV